MKNESWSGSISLPCNEKLVLVSSSSVSLKLIAVGAEFKISNFKIISLESLIASSSAILMDIIRLPLVRL